MKRESEQIFRFILYSLVIYNLYLIIGAPVIIYMYGFATYIAFASCVILIIPLLVIKIIVDPAFIIHLIKTVSLILIVNSWQACFWWQKQTLLGALFLSLSGIATTFFYIILRVRNSQNLEVCCLYLSLLILLFYGALFVIEQKKLFAGNKNIRKLKECILKRCLRPESKTESVDAS